MMHRLSAEVYRCRDCRFGPRDARLGWSDAELDNLWWVTPGEEVSAMVIGGTTIPMSHEVVPCEAHRVRLEAQAG